MFQKCFFFITVFCSACIAYEKLPFPPVYEKISDIYHPTLVDLQNVQSYIIHGDRPYQRMHDKHYLLNGIRIIGDRPGEIPVEGVVAVNCSEEDRENCIVFYCSYNNRFQRGINRLTKLISESDFVGHIRYRIGGWPNIEGGDLLLAHIPYAFKVSFIREAQRLGYKRVLWLDSAVIPKVSLNWVFKQIEDEGYFVFANNHSVGDYWHAEAAEAWGITGVEGLGIPSVQAGIFGVDLTNARSAKLVEEWHAAALDQDKFFTPRSDQSALSILLHQFNMKKWEPKEAFQEVGPHSEGALFLLDYGYVW